MSGKYSVYQRPILPVEQRNKISSIFTKLMDIVNMGVEFDRWPTHFFLAFMNGEIMYQIYI